MILFLHCIPSLYTRSQFQSQSEINEVKTESQKTQMNIGKMTRRVPSAKTGKKPFF